MFRRIIEFILYHHKIYRNFYIEPDYVRVDSISPARYSPRRFECKYELIESKLHIARVYVAWMKEQHDSFERNRTAMKLICIPIEAARVLTVSQILFLWMLTHSDINTDWHLLALTCYLFMRNLWISADSSEPFWDFGMTEFLLDRTKPVPRKILFSCQTEILRLTDWHIYMHPPFLRYQFTAQLSVYANVDIVLSNFFDDLRVKQLIMDYLSTTNGDEYFFFIWANQVFDQTQEAIQSF